MNLTNNQKLYYLKSKFKVMLDEGLIPSTINKSELEELMRTGTLSTEK